MRSRWKLLLAECMNYTPPDMQSWPCRYLDEGSDALKRLYGPRRCKTDIWIKYNDGLTATGFRIAKNVIQSNP